MKLTIVEDYQWLSVVGAQMVAEQVRRQPGSVLGLATGGTPVGMYAELVRMYKEQGLDFSQVITFNLDEYVGLASSDPASYNWYMWHHLFSHINIPLENVHLPNGIAVPVQDECRCYEQAITRAGGIDLQVLGIGSNGHIGFNEPGTPFESETQVICLTEETRRANARYFPDGNVPTHAISMGIKSILKAKRILLLAGGPDKAAAIEQALEGPVTVELPASVLQLHPDVTVVVDTAAAAGLTKAGSEKPTHQAAG